MSLQGFSDEVGFRLASLADGEGHFSIRKGSAGGVQCAFVVKMRHDDERMLRRFQTILGMGGIYHAKAAPTEGRNNQAAVGWQVSSMDQCLRLVEIFDAYPLWSKKRHEYTIWRQAVLTRASMPRPARGRRLNWMAMEELREALLLVRAA